MYSKLNSLFVVIGLFLSVVCFSQDLSISPSGDTYIKISSADESFWDSDIIRVKHSLSGSAERISWIKFNTGGFLNNPEQVILKLVKISGNEGNISLIGADPGFNASSTWNNSPTDGDPFLFGGKRIGDTCLFDVTEYINDQVSNGQTEIAFKIFTTSVIVSTMTFGSSEAESEDTRPKLLFYSNKEYELPLFSLFEDVVIPTENGDFDANLFDKSNTSVEERSDFGGLLGGKSTATGYFRTEKDCEGTWHIIDPEGNMFYSAGLNTVAEGGDINLPTDLKNMGFNTMGSWSDETINDFAYCPRFNVLASFKNTTDEIKAVYNAEILPVFEPTFESFCQQLAVDEVTQYVNDEWVLGYFLDNELLFHKDQLSLSLTLATDNAQYVEADQWMEAKYGASYSLNDITVEDEDEYRGYVADEYFRIVTSAFRAVDSNHLLIGTRVHAGGKYLPDLFEAMGNYVDVITINYYNRFEPEEETMDMWLEYGEKPFIVTEFYTMGDDVGLPNDDGAGWRVPTQQDRADWYENWMLKLLRNKGNVGFHWFRYKDKAGQGSNKGLYSESHEIYEPLGESMEKVCNSIYSLRSQILYGNSNYNDLIDCNSDLCGDDFSSCEVVTSLDVNFSQSDFMLFPNPAKDVISVSNSIISGTIYNIAHEKVQEIEGGEHEYNVSNLKPGVYIFEANFEDGIKKHIRFTKL